ncbi:MAG: ABC transporter permease [Myxococcota bacterium]
MTQPTDRRLSALWMAIPALCVLFIPLAALVMASSPADLYKALSHPVVGPALWLSLRTSFVSLLIIIVIGTPLAWWLARSSGRSAAAIDLLLDLPIVLPPAVIGIALLETFGRAGLFGGALEAFGLQIPFTTSAVILAQVTVSAPFYIKASTLAFRRLEDDLLLVSRTLGHTPWRTFLRVALPMTLPGLVTGAALSWARALGEFGATLLFAGSLPGTTQTMPLAIYTALESDLDIARALALILAGLSIVLLLGLRLSPQLLRTLRPGGRS